MKREFAPINKRYADDEKLYFGNDKDVSFDFDGTDLNLEGTGTWNLTGFDAVRIDHTTPQIEIYESDQAVDEKLWDITATSKQFQIRTRTDADAAGESTMKFIRGTGTDVSDIQWESSNSFNVLSGGQSILRVDHSSNLVRIRDGYTLSIENSADTDYARFSHDGTDFNTNLTNTLDWNVEDLRNFVVSADGDGGLETAFGAYNNPDHQVQLRSTTNTDVLGFTMTVNDGSNNKRAMFFLDDTEGSAGIATTASSGIPDISFVMAGAEQIRFAYVGADDGGLIEFGGENSRANMHAEHQELADDATGTWTLEGAGNVGLVVVVGASDDADCWAGFVEWAGTPSRTDIATGASVSVGNATNPDIDGDTNIWFGDSPDVVNIKNRTGATRQYSVYMYKG